MRVSECPVLPSHEQSMVAVREAQSRYIPQSLSTAPGISILTLSRLSPPWSQDIGIPLYIVRGLSGSVRS